MNNIKTDYQVFRGKCKEVCEHLQAVLPDLRLAMNQDGIRILVNTGG